MQFTVYATKQCIDVLESETVYHKPHRVILYKTDADSIFDAMINFAEHQQTVWANVSDLKWTVTYTNDGFTVDHDGFIDKYTDITFNKF